jgi:hypothetical protein
MTDRELRGIVLEKFYELRHQKHFGSRAMARALKDLMRERLRIVLDAKEITDKQAAQAAGLGDTFVHGFLQRGGGKFENLERLCEANDIRWEWLKSGAGPMTPAEAAIPPPDRETILALIEAVLGHFLPDVSRAPLRAASEILLAIAENPPDCMSGIDKASRIRSGILGALRLFVHQLNRQDNSRL